MSLGPRITPRATLDLQEMVCKLSLQLMESVFLGHCVLGEKRRSPGTFSPGCEWC